MIIIIANKTEEVFPEFRALADDAKIHYLAVSARRSSNQGMLRKIGRL